MVRILMIVAVIAVGCHALAAQFGAFERRPLRLALFAQAEDAPAKPKADPIATEPFALAFWLTPFLRVSSNPDSAGPGIGAEGAYFISKRIAITGSVALYSLLADVNSGEDYFEEEDANGFEATLGVRWRFHRYDGGALYLEFRALYAAYSGQPPIRHTHSIGAGAYFGYEFGGPIVRGYIEGGLGLLGAVNYSDVGWLFNGDRNGGAGLHIELVRVGIRIYV